MSGGLPFITDVMASNGVVCAEYSRFSVLQPLDAFGLENAPNGRSAERRLYFLTSVLLTICINSSPLSSAYDQVINDPRHHSDLCYE